MNLTMLNKIISHHSSWLPMQYTDFCILLCICKNHSMELYRLDKDKHYFWHILDKYKV